MKACTLHFLYSSEINHRINVKSLKKGQSQTESDCNRQIILTLTWRKITPTILIEVHHQNTKHEKWSNCLQKKGNISSRSSASKVASNVNIDFTVLHSFFKIVKDKDKTRLIQRALLVNVVNCTWVALSMGLLSCRHLHMKHVWPTSAQNLYVHAMMVNLASCWYDCPTLCEESTIIHLTFWKTARWEPKYPQSKKGPVIEFLNPVLTC